MSEEKDINTVDALVSLVSDNKKLDDESQSIAHELVETSDADSTKNLINKFNANLSKKDVLRLQKLNALYDKIIDQASTRFEKRPDEISNKELLDYMNSTQLQIEKHEKHLDSSSAQPVIQINQQNNIDINSNSLSKDEQQRVLDAVKQLLQLTKSSDIIDAQDVETKEVRMEEIRDGDE